MNAIAEAATPSLFRPMNRLRATDGCDRCGSPARIRVQVNEPEYEIQSDGTPVSTGEGVLDFCNHHYKSTPPGAEVSHELALLALGAKVIDVRMEGI